MYLIAPWPVLACLGWLMLCQTLNRDDVMGPEDQRVPDLIQALETHTMYCINTCREEAQSQRGCRRTHTCQLPLEEHMNICMCFHANSICVWLCGLVQPLAILQNWTIFYSINFQLFSLFLQGDELLSRTIRFHETAIGDLIEQFITIKDGTQASLQQLLTSVFSFPEATHVHLITVSQTTALQPKERRFLSLLAVKSKLFDAILKQNWEPL